jgi:2-keto-4-pentenoate hydratase
VGQIRLADLPHVLAAVVLTSHFTRLTSHFTRAPPVTPGDVFHADYGRLGGFGFSFGAGG